MSEEKKLTNISGWPVMHCFYRIDRGRWLAMPAEARSRAVGEFTDFLKKASAEGGMQLVPMAGIAKADFAFLAVHPELRRMQQLGQEVAATAFGTCLVPVYSFLSMSEVNEYMTTAGEWAKHLIDNEGMDPASPEFGKKLASFAKRMEKYADSRVHPRLPRDFPVVCFYPMRKTREPGRNWYTLDFDERKKLMIAHGETGRRFGGRVLQLVTSCTGVDDWEWAVTLFSRDLKSIRDVVYEMRYDRASALYAEFGEFFIALRFDPEEVAEVLRL